MSVRIIYVVNSKRICSHRQIYSAKIKNSNCHLQPELNKFFFACEFCTKTILVSWLPQSVNVITRDLVHVNAVTMKLLTLSKSNIDKWTSEWPKCTQTKVHVWEWYKLFCELNLYFVNFNCFASDEARCEYNKISLWKYLINLWFFELFIKPSLERTNEIAFYFQDLLWICFT